MLFGGTPELEDRQPTDSTMAWVIARDLSLSS